MEEARLNHLLRGLPRATAPGGFTAQVLRRLDEKPRPAPGNRPRRLPRSQRWHRLMVATATVGALGVSVGVSVGVLQRERSAVPLPAPPTPMAQPAVPMPGAPGAAGGMATASMERTFRHESGAGELPVLGGRTGLRNAATERGAMTAVTALAATPATPAIAAAQAQAILRELQLERGRLERELRSLRRPGGGLPTVLYLGGDENVDLVLSTGRPRPQGASGERDDGENQNYL